MKSFCACCAVLALLLAPASAAATPQTLAEREADAVADVARATSVYAAVNQQAMSLAEFDIAGVRQAQNLAKSGASVADAQSWAASWQAQLDQKQAALEAQLAAAPSNADALAEMVRLYPGFAAQAQQLRSLPAGTRGMVDAVLKLSTSIRADIGPAVARDPTALRRLTIDLIDGLRSELVGENTLMAGEQAAFSPSHPQWSLLGTILATNQAGIDLYDAVAQNLRGDSVATAALATHTHGLCAAARAAAEQVGPLAARQRSQIDAHGRVDPATQALWYKAWDSYADSGAVEVQIAGECDKIATGLDNGLKPAEALGRATQLKALVDQRMALDSARRADLTKGR